MRFLFFVEKNTLTVVISVQHSRGGSGTTTIALTLSYLLARRGRTLYIEADFLNPILEYLIPIRGFVPKWFNDWIVGEASLGEVSRDISSFFNLPAQSLNVMYGNTSEGARRRMKVLDAKGDKRIMRTLEKEDYVIGGKKLDYVIIDTPPWAYYTIAAISYASTHVLYVLRPNFYEAEIFNNKMKNIYSRFTCLVRPIINFYDERAEKFEKEFYGGEAIKIPFIPEFSSGIDISKIFSVSNKMKDYLLRFIEELPQESMPSSSNLIEEQPY
ncbi:MAG: ParA family protein [Ignisphaera sp.]